MLSLPFRVSRYGVNNKSKVCKVLKVYKVMTITLYGLSTFDFMTDHDFPRCCRSVVETDDGFTVISRLYLFPIYLTFIQFRRNEDKHHCSMHPDCVEVPNRLVDMSSWRRSACYPRSSFYPMSFHHPMLNGRITNIYFRSCSSCQTRSQAGLCVCASCSISIRAKPTFVYASVTF